MISNQIEGNQPQQFQPQATTNQQPQATTNQSPQLLNQPGMLNQQINDNAKYQYLDYTNKLNDYNEIYNVNNYLSNSNQNKLGELQEINGSISAKIINYKTLYLFYTGEKKDLVFKTNFAYFFAIIISIVFLLIAFSMLNKIGWYTTFWISLIIIIIFLVIFYIAMRRHLNKRNFDNNQKYWAPPQKNY